MLIDNKIVSAVDVYLEKRKSRKYVGQLSYEDKKFVFNYDDAYLYDERSIAIGPDLPLSKKKFSSDHLFPSFEDRIPSKDNPAYEEYCEMVGISSSEDDPLTLLATLGQRGPSSFIFSPAQVNYLTYKDIAKFRRDLNLTVREFSDLFDFSPATINRIERNSIAGKESMKRLEIYYLFPDVALYEITKNQSKVNDRKVKLASDFLNLKINQAKR